MAIDKKTFMRSVTVIYDTREQENEHITARLGELGVQVERRKLDFGDYSFCADGRDFSLSCVIERKANVDEIYGNIMKDRERLEKELRAASSIASQTTLLLEGVSSWEELKAYEVPEWAMQMSPQRKVKQTGAHVYSTLKAWSPANRCNIRVEFVSDKSATASKMLEIFYYYWVNYKELTMARRLK